MQHKQDRNEVLNFTQRTVAKEQRAVGMEMTCYVTQHWGKLKVVISFHLP